MNVLATWVLQQMRDDRVRRLVAMPDDKVKSLWDRYDGCNAPDGHEGEDIHLALNIKGLSDYCAV
jgi:hypothetical protein